MAVIKSGNSTDQMTVDPTSKAARVSLYDASGAVVTPATNTVLTNGSQETQLVDGSGHIANIDPAGTLRVNVVTPATLPVSGTFFPPTQPISAVSLPLPTGAAQETGGNLAAIAAAMTNGSAKTQTVSGSGVVADVQPKGVQGANALVTQDLKDSGRVIKNFFAVFTGTVADTLLTLTPSSDGTAGATGTSFTVTAGKRFRIQVITLSINAASTTACGGTAVLHYSATGAVTTASPILAVVSAGLVGTQVAQTGNSNGQAFVDGVELSGTMQFGLSFQGVAVAGFRLALTGYEY